MDQQATGRERTGPGVNVDAGHLSGSPGVTSFLKVTDTPKPSNHYQFMESENYRSVVVKLHLDTLVAIDSLREQWGINSRADIVERILHEVLTPDLAQEKSSDS